MESQVVRPATFLLASTITNDCTRIMPAMMVRIDKFEVCAIVSSHFPTATIIELDFMTKILAIRLSTFQC